MVKPIDIRVISGDPDFYKIAFRLNPGDDDHHLLFVLLKAIQLRMAELTAKAAARVISVSNKSDLFEPFREGDGYVEVDTLHVSDCSIGLEAYLYNADNRLKGKTSCHFHIAKDSPQPEAFGQ